MNTLESTALASRSVPVTPDGMIRTLQLDRRWNGPRRTANGGYAAGTLASVVPADTVTVVLRRPVPLGRDLTLTPHQAGAFDVTLGTRLIAQAMPGELSHVPAPGPPSLEHAFQAREAHPLLGVRHPLSDCVVCGPHRTDGMHVTPGPVPGRPEVLAAPWVVDERVAFDWRASAPAVWAAMDCTSYPAQALRDGVLCLLGTMTAHVSRRPRIGEALVVYSWTRESLGRRHETSVAIVDAHGATVARADSTWIALKHGRMLMLGSRFGRRRPRAGS